MYYKDCKCKTTIGCLYFTLTRNTTKRKPRSTYLALKPAWDMWHVFKSQTIIFTGGIPARSRRNMYSLQLTVSKTLFQSEEEPVSPSRHWTRWLISVFPHSFSSSVKQSEQAAAQYKFLLVEMLCNAVSKVCLCDPPALSSPQPPAL